MLALACGACELIRLQYYYPAQAFFLQWLYGIVAIWVILSSIPAAILRRSNFYKEFLMLGGAVFGAVTIFGTVSFVISLLALASYGVYVNAKLVLIRHNNAIKLYLLALLLGLLCAVARAHSYSESFGASVAVIRPYRLADFVTHCSVVTRKARDELISIKDEDVRSSLKPTLRAALVSGTPRGSETMARETTLQVLVSWRDIEALPFIQASKDEGLISEEAADKAVEELAKK